MQTAISSKLRPHIPKHAAKWIPQVCLILFYVFIHHIIKPNYGDDLIFSQALNQTGLISFLQKRYMTWSSRLLLETALVLVLRQPLIIWATLDIGMVLVLFSGLRELLAPEKQMKDSLFLALLICVYPFFHMGSAGWVTTTVIYLWPLSLAVYAISGMARRLRGVRVQWYRYILYGMSAIFSCNNELIAVMVLAAAIAGFIYAVQIRKLYAIPVSGGVISLAGLLFALITPGNAVRMAKETITWMPDFPTFSLWDKLRIGTVSTLEHFLSIPNAVLFLFLFIIVIHAFRESRSLYKRVVGALPLLMQTAYGIYFMAEKLLITREFNYSIPEIWPADVSDMVFQGILIASFVVMILCIAFSLAWIIEDKKALFLYLFALGAGLATRLSLSFSPTVLASGTRTYMYVYFVLLALTFLLWKRGLPKKIEYLFLGSTFLGVAYNVITVYLLQRKYL